MNSEPSPYTDTLGLVNALVMHMRNRQDPDDLPDERLFRGPINRILAKTQMVIDENFGGDVDAFHTQMLTRMAVAAFENDNEIIAIEHWLDVEWKASAKLYE